LDQCDIILKYLDGLLNDVGINFLPASDFHTVVKIEENPNVIKFVKDEPVASLPKTETMTDKNIDKEDEEDHSYLSDDVGFNDDSCIL